MKPIVAYLSHIHACAGPAADPQALADEMLVTYRDFQRVHHDTLIRRGPGSPRRHGAVRSRLAGAGRGDDAARKSARDRAPWWR